MADPVTRVFTDYYSSGATYSSGSPTTTGTFNSQAGDFLVVAVTSAPAGSPSSASCTDGSLTAGTLLQYDSSREFTRIFYRKITADRTGDSVTVNWSASTNQRVIYTMLYRPGTGYVLSYDQGVAGPVTPFASSSTTSSYNIRGAGVAIGFVGMTYGTAGTTTTIGSSFTKFSTEVEGTAFISEKFPTTALTGQTTTATASVNEYINIHVMSILAFSLKTLTRTYDFTSLANASPWTDTRFEVDTTNSSFQNFLVNTGGLSPASSSPGSARAILIGKNYPSTIISRIALKDIRGYSITDDEVGVAIIVSSGVNKWKGYYARISNTYQSLKRLDDANVVQSSGTGTAGLGSTTTLPLGDGAIYELQFTPSTGALVLLYNNVSLITATDTTYTTNLAAGFYASLNNHGGTGVSSFAANYIGTTMYANGAFQAVQFIEGGL